MTESEDPSRARHGARTKLNHIVGYSEILRQDAVESGLSELASLFGAVGESAAELKGPLIDRLGKGPAGQTGEGPEDELDHEIYGILYAMVALIQDAKGEASSLGASDMVEDIDKLLSAANAVVELMAAEAGSLGEWAPDTGSSKKGELERAGIELPPAPRPGRILVVDDNLFNRELLTRHLERQGHEVRCAADGLAALELLRSERFDVAILDVMMPGMNGYQLLEHIRTEESLKGVEAIVISALEDTQSIARCIQLGAEDYLPREFEPVILKARLESCLEKKRMREEQELYVAALVEAQEKLRAELRGGADYVRSLLPRRIALSGLATDWAFVPSASLGGDVFGYHFLGGEGAAEAAMAGGGRGGAPGRLALYLIDVSGHGIESALYSVTLMNLLKTQVLPGADFGDPSSVLDRLNASFKMEEQNNLFFSAWYGVWDPAGRELAYASAGSPPAILVGPGGEAAELATGGMIVGADPEARYDTARSVVPRGSRLYVFSDGIYEFRSAEGGAIYGFERFVRYLAKTVSSPSGGRTAIERVITGLAAKTKTGRFPDDLSILELRLD